MKNGAGSLKSWKINSLQLFPKIWQACNGKVTEYTLADCQSHSYFFREHLIWLWILWYTLELQLHHKRWKYIWWKHYTEEAFSPFANTMCVCGGDAMKNSAFTQYIWKQCMENKAKLPFNMPQKISFIKKLFILFRF